jgi:CP family cyanate transporter-like MFS transporter
VTTRFFAVLSLFLLAVNLRPAITGVGPLVASIQEATGLSAAAMGLLSSLPLLAFGAFAPLARFGGRLGIERTIAIAMAMITVGTLIRSTGATGALFAGTVLLAAGIAVGNVLAPSIIKRDYAERVGAYTTVYALVLALSAAISAGAAVPLERALAGGWRSSLAFWAAPAAVATALWFWAALHPRVASAPPAATAKVSVWRSPLAWCVTGFMGLQSVCFYVTAAWLPKVLQDRGYDPVSAGFAITGFLIVSLVAGAALPRFLALRRDQRALAVSVSLAIAIGFAGLFLWPQWTLFWIGLTGFGSGVAFPLALAFIGLRSSDHHEAASLSLMSQSMGYLLAAFGPVLFGLAHDLSGGWVVPLGGMAVSGMLQALMGYYAGQSRTVTA